MDVDEDFQIWIKANPIKYFEDVKKKFQFFLSISETLDESFFKPLSYIMIQLHNTNPPKINLF